jgi:hypothetical protein
MPYLHLEDIILWLLVNWRVFYTCPVSIWSTLCIVLFWKLSIRIPGQMEHDAGDSPNSSSRNSYAQRVGYEANPQIRLTALYFVLCSHPTAEILLAGKDLPHHMLATHPSGKENPTSQLCEFILRPEIERSCDSCTCMEEWVTLETKILAWLGDGLMEMTIDPIDSLNEIKDSFVTSEGCWACKSDSRMEIEAKAEAMWSSLPEVFGLASWEHIPQASTHPEVL